MIAQRLDLKQKYVKLKADLLTLAKQSGHHWATQLGSKLLSLKPPAYLTRSQLKTQLPAAQIWQFGAAEAIDNAPPQTLEQTIPEPLARHAQPHSLSQPFVCVVRRAELIGSAGVAVTETGDVILEASTTDEQFSASLGTSVSLLVRKNLPIDLTLDLFCPLHHSYGRNYFHWITEFLTRLEGLEYFEQQTGEKPLLLLNKNPKPWQLESLRLAGYGSNDYREWRDRRAKVNQLVVPSLRRYQEDLPHHRVSRHSIQWLKQRIVGNAVRRSEALPDTALPNAALLDTPLPKQPLAKRIFVSRRRAISRRILNEDAVMEQLASLGFVAYLLEELNVTEQVQLFAQAEFVIAPHGAGLTNIIWSQNAAIVELFGPLSHVRPDYFQLARANELQYGFLMCDFTEKDIVVNLPNLLSLLEKMGIQSH
jgi:capsular polysaccharide biosynthesis protein